MDLKTLNVENLVRSAAVVVVGLPLALSLSNLSGATTQLVERSLSDPTSQVTNEFKEELAGACIRYMVSKSDSKLEREAVVDIEDIVGGSVNTRETCNWVL